MPTLKAFLKARSQSVSGIKRQELVRAIELVVRAIGCQKTVFLRTHDLLVSHETMQTPPPLPPPPSAFPCNPYKRNGSGICNAS